MLNIGTYARATKCACAYGSVQDPPTSIYPRSLASYESMLEATVHWHIRSAKEYQSPVVHDSLLCCKPFFFTTAQVRPRNRDKQGDGRDKAVKIGTVPPKSGQLRVHVTTTVYIHTSNLYNIEWLKPLHSTLIWTETVDWGRTRGKTTKYGNEVTEQILGMLLLGTRCKKQSNVARKKECIYNVF